MAIVFPEEQPMAEQVTGDPELWPFLIQGQASAALAEDHRDQREETKAPGGRARDELDPLDTDDLRRALEETWWHPLQRRHAARDVYPLLLTDRAGLIHASPFPPEGLPLSLGRAEH